MILKPHLTQSISLAGGLLMLVPNGMCILSGLALANKLLDSEDSIEVSVIHVYESNGGLLRKIPRTRE
jgi:hypothetical protein